MSPEHPTQPLFGTVRCPSLTPSARRPCGAAATRGGAGPVVAPAELPGSLLAPATSSHRPVGARLEPRGCGDATASCIAAPLVLRAPLGAGRPPRSGSRSQVPGPGPAPLPASRACLGRGSAGAAVLREVQGQLPPGPGLLIVGSQGSTLHPTSSCGPIAGAGLPGSVGARLPAAGRAPQRAGRQQGLVQ